MPRASSDGPVIKTSDGVRVAIRLTPGATADRIVSVAAAAGGGQVVRASVTAPALDGKANAALLQLLARAWRLPRRDLSIVVGTASRNKTVRVAGDPDELIAKLSREIASLPGG